MGIFGGVGRVVTSKAPEFPEGFEWINVEEALSLKKLRGSVVVLDFWTYSCINCIHMVPVMAKLEDSYKNEPVVIIGVHSAKFTSEQEPKNIAEAVQRYEMRHPVVVDQGMRIWREYGINAWPTVVIIDPKGGIVFKKAGERNEVELGAVIEMLLERHRKDGSLASSPPRFKRRAPAGKAVLSYPGKMSFSKDRQRFALSDSNHNRILIIETKTGKILEMVGSGRRGLASGSFSEASFYRPQGVLWLDDKVYVADTENHALRAIDLGQKAVKTVAGTGIRGDYRPFEYTANGTNTELNSPWDLAFYDNKIIIAMAGLHQLWAFEPKSGMVFPYAGSGRENIVDGSYADAQFAQPSGMFAAGDNLLVADSESSSIRSLDAKRKYVSTLVGSGLFVFGKGDGKLGSARLQHPLGVCAAGKDVYVADTLNSSIRKIDTKAGEVVTVIADQSSASMCRFGEEGCDTIALYEPSDVKIAGDVLYIVDTNNHLVRTFDLQERMLKTLDIR